VTDAIYSYQWINSSYIFGARSC